MYRRCSQNFFFRSVASWSRGSDLHSAIVKLVYETPIFKDADSFVSDGKLATSPFANYSSDALDSGGTNSTPSGNCFLLRCLCA